MLNNKHTTSNTTTTSTTTTTPPSLPHLLLFLLLQPLNQRPRQRHVNMANSLRRPQDLITTNPTTCTINATTDATIAATPLTSPLQHYATYDIFLLLANHFYLPRCPTHQPFTEGQSLAHKNEDRNLNRST